MQPSRAVPSRTGCRVAVPVFLHVLLFACAGPQENAPGATAPSAAGPTIDRTDAPPAKRDLGIGVVYFPLMPDTVATADTLTLRTGPDAGAPWVARFILDVRSGAEWSYRVMTPQGPVTANLLEFQYEESGLPIDSILPDSSWVRLLSGYDAAGSMLRGWAPLRTPRTNHVLWRAWLPERAAYVLGDSVQFFDAPGGRVVDFALEPAAGDGWSAFDHHLEPDSVAGDWLRVRVVTPSNACGIDVPVVRDTTVWLRYLDARERPLVWYFSRGC